MCVYSVTTPLHLQPFLIEKHIALQVEDDAAVVRPRPLLVPSRRVLHYSNRHRTNSPKEARRPVLDDGIRVAGEHRWPGEAEISHVVNRRAYGLEAYTRTAH